MHADEEANILKCFHSWSPAARRIQPAPALCKSPVDEDALRHQLQSWLRASSMVPAGCATEFLINEHKSDLSSASLSPAAIPACADGDTNQRLEMNLPSEFDNRSATVTLSEVCPPSMIEKPSGEVVWQSVPRTGPRGAANDAPVDKDAMVENQRLVKSHAHVPQIQRRDRLLKCLNIVCRSVLDQARQSTRHTEHAVRLCDVLLRHALSDPDGLFPVPGNTVVAKQGSVIKTICAGLFRYVTPSDNLLAVLIQRGREMRKALSIVRPGLPKSAFICDAKSVCLLMEKILAESERDAMTLRAENGMQEELVRGSHIAQEQKTVTASAQTPTPPSGGLKPMPTAGVGSAALGEHTSFGRCEFLTADLPSTLVRALIERALDLGESDLGSVNTQKGDTKPQLCQIYSSLHNYLCRHLQRWKDFIVVLDEFADEIVEEQNHLGSLSSTIGATGLDSTQRRGTVQIDLPLPVPVDKQISMAASGSKDASDIGAAYSTLNSRDAERAKSDLTAFLSARLASGTKNGEVKELYHQGISASSQSSPEAGIRQHHTRGQAVGVDLQTHAMNPNGVSTSASLTEIRTSPTRMSRPEVLQNGLLTPRTSPQRGQNQLPISNLDQHKLLGGCPTTAVLTPTTNGETASQNKRGRPPKPSLPKAVVDAHPATRTPHAEKAATSAATSANCDSSKTSSFNISAPAIVSPSAAAAGASVLMPHPYTPVRVRTGLHVFAGGYACYPAVYPFGYPMTPMHPSAYVPMSPPRAHQSYLSNTNGYGPATGTGMSFGTAMSLPPANANPYPASDPFVIVQQSYPSMLASFPNMPQHYASGTSETSDLWTPRKGPVPYDYTRPSNTSSNPMANPRRAVVTEAGSPVLSSDMQAMRNSSSPAPQASQASSPAVSALGSPFSRKRRYSAFNEQRSDFSDMASTVGAAAETPSLHKAKKDGMSLQSAPAAKKLKPA